MHEAAQLLLITGVLILSVVSPGPNFAIVTSTATSVSRRAGVLTAIGLAAATGTWVIMAVAGVGVLLARVPWLLTAVKTAGAAYLIWLGIKMLLSARKPMVEVSSEGLQGSAAIRKAYVVSMTNPKSLAFYGSLFTAMVPAGASAWFYAAVVLIAVLVSLGWYGGLALLFSHRTARKVFGKAKTMIETTMGLVLIGMGGKLLVSR